MKEQKNETCWAWKQGIHAVAGKPRDMAQMFFSV